MPHENKKRKVQIAAAWVGSVRSSYVTHQEKILEMALILAELLLLCMYNHINLHEKDYEIGCSWTRMACSNLMIADSGGIIFLLLTLPHACANFLHILLEMTTNQGISFSSCIDIHN